MKNILLIIISYIFFVSCGENSLSDSKQIETSDRISNINTLIDDSNDNLARFETECAYSLESDNLFILPDNELIFDPYYDEYAETINIKEEQILHNISEANDDSLSVQ